MEELKGRFDLITSEFPWLVCEIDGVVAAYAYAGKPFTREGYKWNTEVSVYTDAAYQGKRLAAALYECILEILQVQGYYNVYARILSTNEKSMRFHEKYGFKVVNIFENVVYKHNRWCNVIWMNKTLREFNGQPEEPTAIGDINKKINEDYKKWLYGEDITQYSVKWNGKEYFMQEVLQGDESRFIGISELNTEIKTGIPIFRVPECWKVTV